MSNPVNAQPAPQEPVIPGAIENVVKYHPDGTVDWAATQASEWTYPPNWQPGDKIDSPDEGTIADTLNREFRAGTITREQALESAQNSGLTTGPGAYEPS